MNTKLRSVRQQKGITQTYLARKLGFKTVSGYNNIEMGRTKPSLESAKILAEILEISIEELFFEESLHE